MTRQTSIDCYHQIKSSGLLSAKRLEVLESIVRISPCTTTEAMRFVSNNSVGFGSRFTELRDAGVIYERQQRKCKITGRTVIEWDLTGNMPVKPTKTISNKPRNFNKAIDYIVKGMDLRNWNSIDKSMLIKLKTKKDATKKKEV
jgi:hypothetical protein